MDHILLIRLKSMGDVVFTLPAVHALRENFPAAKISFLTSKENGPLLRGFRAVDKILTLDRALLSAGHPLKIAGELFPLLRQLRAEEYSLVLDFQGYGESELLSWWSGASARWGIVYKPARGWMYTGTSFRISGTHPAEWNLDLLRAAGLNPGPVRNDYVLPASDLALAREFFAAQELDCQQPTLFVQPFTSSAAKNWPLEHFLEVARHWRSRGGQIIFGGGPAERTALEPARAAGFAVAAGAPLLVSAGLMNLSTLVVGGDTGLLHLAVALGRRVIMLMRTNDTGSSHPFEHPDWTVKPAAGKAMAEIEPSQVLDAVEQAFTELHTPLRLGA